MTCARQDKIKYPSRKAAAQAAASARKRTQESINAYHCARCHCWHIGHTPSWNRGTSWSAHKTS